MLPDIKPEEVVVQGDYNGDKKVTLIDAKMTLRAALKIDMVNERQLKAADVDGNGVVELADAREILKYALKITNTFE